MKRFVLLGAAAGAAGGVALAVFLRLVGEGPIRQAVALEAAGAPAAHEEVFSRATQELGGMAGAILYGVLMGVIAAVVLAAVRHRLGGRDDWERAVRLAGAAFVTLALVPALKYPANPPAVGDPDTVGRRTALWLLFLGWSCLATWAGWRLARAAAARGWDRPARVPAAVGLWAATLAVGLVAFPASPDAVEAPATLVWQFRLASLAGAAVFWAATGLALGALLAGASRHQTATLAAGELG